MELILFFFNILIVFIIYLDQPLKKKKVILTPKIIGEVDFKYFLHFITTNKS